MKNKTTTPMSAWVYDPMVKPQDYAAIVYRITMPDDQFYIGKKALWVLKAGKTDRESDWQTYWGSSAEVVELARRHGLLNCRREVLHFCVSRGHASWLEAVALIKGDCLLDPLCLNGNVLERFNRKVVRGYSDDTRREKYLAEVAAQLVAAGLK